MWKQGQVKEANLIKTQTPLIDSQRQQEVNDQIFRHVQEMFDGKVDGDVVFIILQELEWNGVLSHKMKSQKYIQIFICLVKFSKTSGYTTICLQ